MTADFTVVPVFGDRADPFEIPGFGVLAVLVSGWHGRCSP
jgi:hypothetical protein